MTKDILDAIKILHTLYEDEAGNRSPRAFERLWVLKTLRHAIGHLAYPDRDVYPKVRHARKTVPVVKT